MSTTTNQKYNAGKIPSGGFFVSIYRPVNVEASDPTVDTLLGRYLVEATSPTVAATITKRPGTDGGKNGWFMTEGDTEGSATIQRNVAATPSVANGDYFDAALNVGADGVAVAQRFVIHSPNPNLDPSYRKQSVSVIVDDQSPLNVAATNSQSST